MKFVRCLLKHNAKNKNELFRMTMNNNDRNTGLNVVLSMMQQMHPTATSEHRICVYRINVVLSMIQGLGPARNDETDVD